MSALNLIGLASGNPDFVARWNEGCRESHLSEQKWIAELRANGIKAAHPDDGWVDRKENSVLFAYPQFNDGVKAGDLVALGWHFNKTRIVRIREVIPSRFFDDHIRYHFDSAT